MVFLSHSDLVIVGAGPHGLAMALRWVQGSVGNFSDHEHTVQSYLKNKEKVRNSSKRESMTVIDPAGEWMAKWNSLFLSLNIHYLRSTMFMHPDTFDLYSFLAFAHSNGRQSELIPITELYCEHHLPVSEQKRKKKENKKYKGFSLFPENRREVYFRPSQKLFKDFCDDLIRKNQLDDVVVRGSVVSTEILQNGRICITLDTSQKIEAKHVVFATGFAQPLLPAPERVMHSGEWCGREQKRREEKEEEETRRGEVGGDKGDVGGRGETPEDGKREGGGGGRGGRGRKLLVVGGGLTSAHLVSAAIDQGYEKVVLVSRKYVVTKLFDLDLAWMGACRNLQYSKFWNLRDYQDKIEMIKDARGGGSITIEARRHLATFEEQGLLQIKENCEVESVEVGKDSIKVNFNNCGPEEFNDIWVATGSKIDILEEPHLSSYLQSNTIATKCGFPILDQNLRLHPKHNIFVMGGYSSLQLGPDARNLSGCRNAADRICAFIENSKISKIEKFESAKISESQNSRNSRNLKEQDGKWSNFGNEGFNAFSVSYNIRKEEERRERGRGGRREERERRDVRKGEEG